jgi:hypothetical protein
MSGEATAGDSHTTVGSGVPVLGKRSTTASAGPMVTINIAVMSSIIVTNTIKHLMRHLLTLTLPT